MSVHYFSQTQQLPIPLAKAWEFFSSPNNLNEITPPDLHFRMLSNADREQIYSGQIITYKVSPLWRVPLFWMTEITHVDHHRLFVDEQRKGPYALWHHTHRFTEINGGIEMRDQVYYELPLGPLGDWVHALWVKDKIKAIFAYRYRMLEQKFGHL